MRKIASVPYTPHTNAQSIICPIACMQLLREYLKLCLVRVKTASALVKVLLFSYDFVITVILQNKAL